MPSKFKNMNKKLITIIIVLLIPVVIWIVRDYQRRMVIVNANYFCNVAGDDRYCNYLIELDMRKEVK